MSGWSGRFVRVAVPAVCLYFWGLLSAQPYMVGLIPVVSAFGKYLRDKNPDAFWVRWLPF